MSAQVFNFVAQRVLKDVAGKNINSKDPYFEEVAVYGRNGRPTGKVKKQKKGIPHGLSQNDGRVLKGVRKQAYRLDMSLFNCCGIRFGWSSVIGFLPIFGDALDLFMAWLVVQRCCRIDGGLPSAIQYRMYLNIILDFGIGLVPFLGDLADAVFRANTRNAWILEEYLIQKSAEEKNMQYGRPHDKLSSSGGDGAAHGSGGRSGGRSGSPQKTPGVWSGGAPAGHQSGGHQSGHEMSDLDHAGRPSRPRN